MSDQSSNGPPNGAASDDSAPKPRSVRDVAEAVYDDLTQADSGGQDGDIIETLHEAVDESGRQRDASGRFVAKEAAEPGEADVAAKPVPAPTPDAPSAETPAQPAPEQPGKSIELPPHWPESDRKTFAELTPGGKELFVRRYSEMERDYTQKTQAAAQAVGFVQSVAPIFQNPHMADSLQRAGVAPSNAIEQWGQFHLGIVHPDPNVRLATVQEIMRRAQIDPAALAASQQGLAAQLPPEVAANPAIKVFVDHIKELRQEIATNRNEFHAMRDQQARGYAQQVEQQTRAFIDNFADEKDANGRLLHPHFDLVIDDMMELYRANPQRDISDAYKRACRMNEQVFQLEQQAAKQTAEQQASNQRAALAAKSNLRGRTTPVAGPNGADTRLGLRATLEAAADEAGFNN